MSRWTPPVSAGRQLTLNDLLTWKQIRTPLLSNDGRWFVYTLGPNEGDAEVVIRPTSADGKEWRFPVGDAAALNRGAPAPTGPPAAAAPNTVAISGNSHWVAFLVYPSSATPQRSRPTASTPPTPPASERRWRVSIVAEPRFFARPAARSQQGLTPWLEPPTATPRCTGLRAGI